MPTINISEWLRDLSRRILEAPLLHGLKEVKMSRAVRHAFGWRWYTWKASSIWHATICTVCANVQLFGLSQGQKESLSFTGQLSTSQMATWY